MPSIVFLVDKQIDASMTRLFTLNDIDGTPLAGIDWAGDDIYSPCITILRDGVSINYDGVILNNRVTQQDGTLTIAPPPKWYSRQGNIPSSEWKNRNKGDRFFILQRATIRQATCRIAPTIAIFTLTMRRLDSLISTYGMMLL